jgi:hypothetical protein
MEIVDMGITKFWIWGPKSRSVNNSLQRPFFLKFWTILENTCTLLFVNRIAVRSPRMYPKKWNLCYAMWIDKSTNWWSPPPVNNPPLLIKYQIRTFRQIVYTSRFWVTSESSQNSACLVGKSFPHPVGVFCDHLEPPSCHIAFFLLLCLRGGPWLTGVGG